MENERKREGETDRTGGEHAKRPDGQTAGRTTNAAARKSMCDKDLTELLRIRSLNWEKLRKIYVTA